MLPRRDVNGTASPNSLLGSDTRTFAGNLALSLEATKVVAGETFTLGFDNNVVLEFNGATVSNGFELFQNTPNPFKAETAIGFNMPQAGAVTLKIHDE